MAGSRARLTEFAADVVWHLAGFAQGMFDVVTVTVLALAIYASAIYAWGVGGGPAGPERAMLVAHAAPICQVNCITAMVLKPQDS